MYFYDKYLCSKCKRSLNHYKELHLNLEQLPCVNNIQSFVYLIHDLDNDLYKIGHSKDVHKRLYELTHGSSSKNITLIAYFSGSNHNEKVLHSMFKHSRIRREWFESNSDILEYFLNHPNVVKVDN